jgi:hypothetical protein
MDQTIIKVTGGADVIAYVSYSLGFMPAESLVFVSVNNPRGRVGPMARADRQGLATRAAGRQVADHMRDGQRGRFGRTSVHGPRF